jgi:hypothetical protein
VIATLDITSRPVQAYRWMRRQSYRPVMRYYAWHGSIYVGQMVTVIDDDFAGLIAWVTVDRSLRGQGYGIALHRAVQRHINIPLLIDITPPTDRNDRVERCEYDTWTRMARMPDWRAWRDDTHGVVCGEVRR